MFSYLFSPMKLRGLELKNRIIMPAMGTKFPKDNEVTEQLIQYHVDRAKGGSGLNMVEVTGVHQPSVPGIYPSLGEDRFIPGMKRLTDAIHEAGGKAGVQLWQGSIAVAAHQGIQVIVASDLELAPGYVVKGADKALIDELTTCYGKAAHRAVEAGYDCVEVHMAHNYILHSFLSPAINKRTDEYGGTFENRARFPLAVIESIRKNIPDDMPLFMRIDAQDDYLENGMSIEDVIAFCKLAKEAGVDVLDISRGNIISAGIKFEVPPIDLPRAFNIENAARIRRETGMVTMGVGRINDPELADRLLQEDKLDLVGIGRAQLADPEFCNKSKEGRLDDIVRCVGCNQGCYDACESHVIPHITCLRNPALGKENEYRISKTKEPKTVLIAGGGMAGMEAADVLYARGHHPVLCEASDRLGGQFLLAGEAPRKLEMKLAAMSKGEQITRRGVDVRLNAPVTPALIEELKPDAVINAIGALPIIPPIPGINLPHVKNSHEILGGKASVEGNVVVIGGGLVGLETAEYLSDKGCKVTVVEMLEGLGTDLGTTRKVCVMENLYMEGVTQMPNCKCLEITGDGVVVDNGGEKQTIPCDYVVAAVGVHSADFSAEKALCKENGIPVYTIGDAEKPRRAIDATADAARIAREI